MEATLPTAQGRRGRQQKPHRESRPSGLKAFHAQLVFVLLLRHPSGHQEVRGRTARQRVGRSGAQEEQSPGLKPAPVSEGGSLQRKQGQSHRRPFCCHSPAFPPHPHTAGFLPSCGSKCPRRGRGRVGVADTDWLILQVLAHCHPPVTSYKQDLVNLRTLGRSSDLAPVVPNK